MSKITVEETNIQNCKNKNIKIALISDIHDDGKKSHIKKYKKTLKIIKEQNPDFICIPGDIITKGGTNLENVTAFISSLGQIAPTILSLGNHELKVNKKYKKEILNWYKSLKENKNVYPLDNSTYETKDITFVGITNNLKTTMNKYKKSWDKIFIKDYDEIKVKLNPNKYNILLAHNPYIICECPKIKEKVKDYNLILSGHMHNGCTPTIIANIFDKFKATKSKGIFSPYGKLFISHTRNQEQINENCIVVISKGFRKVTHTKILFALIDKLYRKHIHILNIEKTK